MASPSVIRFLSFLCFFIYSSPSALAQAPGFYVAAPNIIRIGEQETVAIAHDGPAAQRVTLYLQDYPGKKNTFSNLEFEVTQEKSQIVRVQVRADDVVDADFTDPNIRNYVVLVVKSGTFEKEVVIPISSKSGYVFIQTDKPIYTPKQDVNIRIIPLNERTLPTHDQFKLQIRNPQNVIVKEDLFRRERGALRKAFISSVYKFPPQTLLGEWSIIALYGTEFQHNTSVKFEVAEYVLPTFSLRLHTPEVILPNDKEIKGSVSAVYVYGKKVEGYATFKFGVKANTGDVIYFGVSKASVELDDGVAEFRISTDGLKNHKDIGWFPEISGNSFVVEATVVDFASGNKEVIRDHAGRFSESPFEISFKRCLKDFKPGLVSVVEADVTYVNGRPAQGIETIITAVANGNIPLNINNPMSVSDEEGRVTFLIHPEIQHTTVTVTLTTNVQRFGGNQAAASHTQEKFLSKNNAYIAISRRSGKTLKPFTVFAEDIFMEPAEMSDVYYMVVSRGIILLMNKLPKGNFKSQKVEFQITYDMVPNFRLIVFAHYKNELIADSLNVDVSNDCAPNAKVVIQPEFPATEPGSNGKIIITGFKNTLVGLLAVDEAVYSLRNKDLLTKTKMFKTMESHDLGCGPGGGRSTNVVLGNAGIVIMTNVFAPSFDQTKVPACELKARRKREIVEEMAQNYTGKEETCCKLGMMKHHSNLSCYERAEIVKRYEPDDSVANCSAAFLDCCLNNAERIAGSRPGLSGTINRERIGIDDEEIGFVDIVDEADFERDITVRSDFRETWFFDDKIIGPDNREVMDVSLPHSITTWVIQAVSVSEQFGMCVADPEKVVAFQNVFLQLNLPYSVVRNEQVEIQAVVFNYGAIRLPVVVYMYGVKDICSGAQAGEKSERKRIYVEPQSANSVTFPIIPLKTGQYNIRVTALSNRGSDVIIKTLNVVPEGYTVERSILLKLDPTNQQRRTKRHIETESFSDSIDENKNLQVSAVKLTVPEEFIPDTDSCIVTALGNEFGPIVETSLQDPDKLILLPRGCGEQNMMFMAPTMYTMRYLKVTGKMTKENEEKGYDFIRKGYERELNYRLNDGSYSAFGTGRPASVWLTAFVMKVFCQANKLVRIDENVMCSGLKWLVDKQQPDGSFIDHHPVVHRDMTGGVGGTPSMTAFVLIALQECSCDTQNLEIAKSRAASFLENHLAEINQPLPIAIAAYALALSGSDARNTALEKLQAIERYDAGLNTLHWETGKGTQDIEVTSYGLLTYLQFNDMTKGNAIVNWLNTKRLASGSFPSTQDTVMALQALSDYAIQSKSPGIRLFSNITSSNDRNLHKTLEFNEDNALIQQYVELKKIGGMLFVNTEGHGVGVLAVRLKYNVPTPPEKLCKFELKLNVAEVKAVPSPKKPKWPVGGGANDVFNLDKDLIRAVGVGEEEEGENQDEEVELDLDPRARRPARSSPNSRASRIGGPVGIIEGLVRNKRENKPEKSALVLNVQICVRYLGERPTGMAIVDAGIFSGFVPVKEDLDKLVNSQQHFIDKYEITSRSIIFYLDKTPTEDYCYDFKINRAFIVGNTQMSVVRVYDYYSPEESCTQFYSPDQNSPMLRKICSGGICQCAEGGCPPKNPFAKVIQIEHALNIDDDEKTSVARDELITIACNENDYVWKGRPTEITRSGGFLRIQFLITAVLKEGIEKTDDLNGEVRVLLARDNCESAELNLHQIYLIMGKDGEKYLGEDGNFWHRYLLDRSTSIHKWTSIKTAESKFLQKALNYIERKLPEKGCRD